MGSDSVWAFITLGLGVICCLVGLILIVVDQRRKTPLTKDKAESRFLLKMILFSSASLFVALSRLF